MNVQASSKLIPILLAVVIGIGSAPAAAQQDVPTWVERGARGPAHERLGLLGYSTMDERYEWVTIDRANANMMIYLGEPGSGQASPITMSGVFTDQGMIGEETVGEPIGQRTVIQIVSDERHIVELYFTAPNGEEFLADRSVYTRVQR